MMKKQIEVLTVKQVPTLWSVRKSQCQAVHQLKPPRIGLSFCRSQRVDMTECIYMQREKSEWGSLTKKKREESTIGFEVHKVTVSHGS